MKKFLILAAGPAYLLLLAGFTCTNHGHNPDDPEVGKAFFWKKTDPGTKQYLFVDEQEKGELPYLPDSLTTRGNDIVHTWALSFELKPGTHAIISRDSEGHIICEGTLYLKKTKSSQETKTSWHNSNCSVEVSYNN